MPLEHMETLEGEAIGEAPGNGWIVRIPFPAGLLPERAMLVRFV